MTLNELLQIVLPKYGLEVPQGSFLDAAAAVSDTIAQRLWLNDSDLLRGAVQETLDAGESECVLAATIMGLAEAPWISNSELTPGRELVPLPAFLRHTFTEEDHPHYFEQRGQRLILYPTPHLDTTIKLEVFARPTAFTALSDTLPWFGMFDQVYAEAVPRFGLAGGLITVTPEIAAFIHQRVDLLVERRPLKTIIWRHPA